MVESEERHGSPDACPWDTYLQPHSDDICFSLGGFAYQRHCGTLLTVLSVSAHVQGRRAAVAPTPDWVTKTRIAEDKAFAEACGLTTRFLGLQDALLLNRRIFSLGWVNENLQRIKSPLLDALFAVPADGASDVRPWLFCPIGIGGHVDHVAVRMLVNQHYDLLSSRYRIGFYEDLHYASSVAERSVGINNFLQERAGRQLHRYVFPLGKFVSKKLALIQLYNSQLAVMPRSIEGYTPAVELPNVAHEAIWSDQPGGPLLERS